MTKVIDTQSVNIKFAGRTADTIQVRQHNDDSYSLSKTSNSSLNVSYTYSFGDLSGTKVPVHVWLNDHGQNPVKKIFVETVYFSDVTSLTSNTQDTQI